MMKLESISTQNPESEQQPELHPEPNQRQKRTLNQTNSQNGNKMKNWVGPNVVRHPPKVFTNNTLGQPTIILAQILYLDGAIQLSSHPGCFLCISIIHHPVMPRWCMQMIYAWCIQIYLLNRILINVVAERTRFFYQQWNFQSSVLSCLSNRQSSDLVTQELWLCYFQLNED